MSTKSHRIYLSYARTDASQIPLLLRKLEAMELIGPDDTVVSDKDLESGHASLREGVRRQIQSASKVVIFWSRSSASSQWVNYELGLADALGKTVIPVVRHADLPSLPPQLQEWQAVVLGEGDA